MTTIAQKKDFDAAAIVDGNEDKVRYKLLRDLHEFHQLFVAKLKLPFNAKHNENKEREWYRADCMFVDQFPPGISTGCSVFIHERKIEHYDVKYAVQSDCWNPDLDEEDSNGIHYFKRYEDLVRYVRSNPYDVFAQGTHVLDLDGNVLF